jgi:signal transduction histidine kinase/FixJ family two-component response regulator
METGLRGFLLTREPRFLQPYYVARGQLDTELARLDALATGRTQSGSVGAIDGAIHSYITTYAQPLIATAGNVTRRQAAAVTAHGKQLVDALRHRFAVFDGQELAARQARRNQLASQSNETIAIAAVGLVVSTILLVLLGAYVVRRVLRPIRRVAAALEQRRQGNLSVRVPEEGLGEVGELTRTFNEMAESLEKRTNELSDANRRLARAVAAAQEASRMKSDFLANMSHEIRTPMNGVLGMIQLLEQTELTPQQRRYSGVARSSGLTLLALIDDILDLAKIEAHKIRLENLGFSLFDTVADVVNLLRVQATAKKLDFRSSLSPGIPPVLCGDAHRLRQVVTNLISNAIKFTAHGEVTVDAALESRTARSATVRFAVSDTGIGIRPGQLAALFSPFVQADASTTRKYGGTGLGLAICKQLVEMMGGTIGVNSREGEGSTFWFTVVFQLPRPTPQPSGGIPHTGETRDLPRATVNRSRILIAEDNATNREVALAQLQKLGYQANAVTDGAEALQELGRGRYDLVLMDCEMPVMDGFEATRSIRGGSKHSIIPIVAMTASAMQTDRDRCRRAGMSDFIAKPVDLRELAEVLARWLPVSHDEGPEKSVFDAEALLRRLMGDRQLAELILRRFLDDFPAQLNNLSQRLAETDASGARKQAHALRGAAATVAAENLQAVALALEQAGTAGQLDRCGELLPRAAEEFAKFRGTLERGGWV